MPACRQPGCSSATWSRRVGCSSVQRPGRRGEEPERVEVACSATGGSRRPRRCRSAPEPQRPARVPHLAPASAGRPSPTRAGRSSRAAPAGPRWPPAGCRTKLTVAPRSSRYAVDVQRVTPSAVGACAGQQPARRPAASSSTTRRPGASGAAGRPERVVGEEEVLDRVRLADGGPGAATGVQASTWAWCAACSRARSASSSTCCAPSRSDGRGMVSRRPGSGGPASVGSGCAHREVHHRPGPDVRGRHRGRANGRQVIAEVQGDPLYTASPTPAARCRSTTPGCWRR